MAIPEDFASRSVKVDDADIFVRTGGSGPPLLLLHGFPQTHLSWSRIAAELSTHFTLVIADLTGYGQSRGPAPLADGSNYSKRAVARQMAGVMAELGHSRFSVAGHDRGGRVAYRMALDHPERIDRLAVLSILPTHAMWRRLADGEKAINAYHWFLLAQKPPIPQDLIAGAPDRMIRNTLASWTKSQTLDAFEESEIAEYVAAYSIRRALDSVCADYRASWTTDRKLDEINVSKGTRIACPTLCLWGADEYSAGEMKTAWDELAEHVEFRPLDCGHFVVEEAPSETLAALTAFFRS